MKNLHILLILLVCFVSCQRQSTSFSDTDTDSQQELELQVRQEYGIPVDSFSVAEGVVREGELLSTLLTKLGAESAIVAQLGAIPAEAFDVRKFRSGRSWRAYYSRPDSVLSYFVYLKDVQEAVVFDVRDSLHVERQIKEILHQTAFAQAVISSSLWNAMTEAGCNPQLAVEVSEIYQWTVDFFSLQPGDSIRLFYDQQFVDSVPIGFGRIYCSALYHGGRWLEAYYYRNDSLATPVRGYFAADGTNLKRAFLKAPLNYKRISSTFTYHRKHPIHGIVRPHTGVDYAAPLGTPVVTIGDGTVIEKGYKGGGGNTVKIRHNSVYTTAYLHLQKYAKGLTVGQHVSQGDLIGYVGSTGHSTGPHLDFRVWKNGQPVNPLTMDAPQADPIPEELMSHFRLFVDSIRSQFPCFSAPADSLLVQNSLL